MFYFLPKKPKLKLNQNYSRRSRLVKPFIRFIVRVIWRQRRRKVGNLFLGAEQLDKYESLGGQKWHLHGAFYLICQALSLVILLLL